jgi:hypothetical protein
MYCSHVWCKRRERALPAPASGRKTLERNWWRDRAQNKKYPLTIVGKKDKSGRPRKTHGHYDVAKCADISIEENVYSFSLGIPPDKQREKVSKRITPIL